ncbi:hypothetical protein NQD34_009241 [Periophthalmus magnuspinnatus]|nr:hypothetical protein NQD34_009241 [Periophthalmus magnuspinnatus]
MELWRVELWRVELWRVVLLVWLWTSAGGQEPETVSCVVMETCVLPCSSDEGDIDLIRWLKTDNEVVHVSVDGTDQLQKQAPSFRGRTSLFPEQISRGNASLQLSHVKESDQGSYLCQTFTSNSGAKTWVHLRVKGKNTLRRRTH